MGDGMNTMENVRDKIDIDQRCFLTKLSSECLHRLIFDLFKDPKEADEEVRAVHDEPDADKDNQR